MSHPFGKPYETSPQQEGFAKRERLLSASDEDIQTCMDQKGYSYRKGWPSLDPLPLMTSTRQVDKIFTLAQKQDLENKVKVVLQAQKIGQFAITTCFRVPEHLAYVVDDLTPYLTVLFTADFLTVSADRIERCIIQIRQNLIKVLAFDKVKIECVHAICHPRAPTFGIRHTDTAVSAQSNAVFDFVIQRLSKAKAKWLCIEVVRRGLIDDYHRCAPTIVVTSPSADDSEWYTTVLPSIQTWLVANAPAFKIEVLHAKSIFLTRQQYIPTNTVGAESYKDTVWMGTAIGLESDDNSAATLGGCVVLKQQGSKPEQACALTNWHVVRDDRLDKALSPKTLALEPDHPTLIAKPQYMAGPPTKDHLGYLGTIQRQLKGFKDHGREGLWKEKNDHYIDTSKKERRIGHVYAGSGFRHAKKPRYATNPATGGVTKDKSKAMLDFSLDWALVAISNPTKRTVENILPPVAPEPGTEIFASLVCDRWSTFNVNSQVVSVAKVGRTTGWTHGLIASELIRIDPEVSGGMFEDLAEEYGFLVSKPGFCFQVTSGSTKTFVETGDSGSVLLHDPSGTWLGLCFGRTGAGNGMFMPIDHVWQDIKLVTGREISIPSFVEPETVGLSPAPAGSDFE